MNINIFTVQVDDTCNVVDDVSLVEKFRPLKNGGHEPRTQNSIKKKPGYYDQVKKDGAEEKSLNPYVPKTTKGIVPTTTDAKRDFQTSGLRKPSPKIGFFDEVSFYFN